MDEKADMVDPEGSCLAMGSWRLGNVCRRESAVLSSLDIERYFSPHLRIHVCSPDPFPNPPSPGTSCLPAKRSATVSWPPHCIRNVESASRAKSRSS